MVDSLTCGEKKHTFVFYLIKRMGTFWTQSIIHAIQCIIHSIQRFNQKIKSSSGYITVSSAWLSNSAKYRLLTIFIVFRDVIVLNKIIRLTCFLTRLRPKCGWLGHTWVCLAAISGSKVCSFGQWVAANGAALPRANAGQYATLNCKLLLS